MADAQLSTSITSISERASEVAQAASADDLQKISRVAPSLEQSENAALEVAINTRAAAIAGTASAGDLKKIGKAIGNMLEPQTTSVSGEFIGSQTNHAGKFFSTNGTSKNWGGVTMGGLQQVQLSTIENDQTLVYNSVSGKFENSSRAFDIPEYSLTQNLPASGTTGEVVFDVQASQLKYWDGSEWKTAAVVAAAGGGASGVVTDYHTTYLAETGGTLFEVTYSGSGVDSLNATIDSMSSGDALLLSAGQYVIDSTVGNDSTYGQSLTRNKDIAIVGNTLEPKDVVVTGNPVQSGEAYTIFEWNSTLQRQFANMRLIRKPVGTHDYQVSISGNNPGAGSGKMKNVILDFDGGGASWAYRNTGIDSNSIILENISFVNYSSWLTNHNSQNYHITIINSGFEGTYNDDHPFHANSSNLVENVTYDSNYDYTDTTLYGHKKDMVAPQGSSGESSEESSSAVTTLMVVGNQNSYYGASGIYVYDASDLSAQATKLTPAGIDSGDRFGLYVAANSEFIFASANAEN